MPFLPFCLKLVASSTTQVASHILLHQQVTGLTILRNSKLVDLVATIGQTFLGVVCSIFYVSLLGITFATSGGSLVAPQEHIP